MDSTVPIAAAPKAKRSQAESNGTETEQANKRLKHGGQHVPSCSDASCEGCSAGEIDIDLKIKIGDAPPSAAELYKLAMEERDAITGHSASSGITSMLERRDPMVVTMSDSMEAEEKRKVVIKLFEMAIEKFEEGTGISSRRNGSESLESTVTQEPTSANLTSWLMFAQCLLDFGCYLPLDVYIERSIDLFNVCVSAIEGKGSATFGKTWGATAAYFGLGRASMELLRVRYTKMIEEEDDDEDEANDETDEHVLPQSELDLVSKAKHAINKGLTSPSVKGESHAIQSIAAARLFREYAVLQRHRPRTRRSFNHMIDSLRTALAYIERAGAEKPGSVTMSFHAHEIHAACLYYLADLLHKSMEEDENALDEALKCAKAAEQLFEQLVSEMSKNRRDRQSAEILELRGQNLIVLGSIEPDEDSAVTYFDEGVRCLTESLEINPDNEGIREQLLQMGESGDAGDTGAEDSEA
ncbi:hypothetical protein BC832DRAFT_589872 [Gaertneriomyces semiglobifer]|nr:hypothetical protein BC832DRAFT_589872 [Gaertneriomyces semiglobifer]